MTRSSQCARGGSVRSARSIGLGGRGLCARAPLCSPELTRAVYRLFSPSDEGVSTASRALRAMLQRAPARPLVAHLPPALTPPPALPGCASGSSPALSPVEETVSMDEPQRRPVHSWVHPATAATAAAAVARERSSSALRWEMRLIRLSARYSSSAGVGLDGWKARSSGKRSSVALRPFAFARALYPRQQDCSRA